MGRGGNVSLILVRNLEWIREANRVDRCLGIKLDGYERNRMNGVLYIIKSDEYIK